MAKFEAVDPRTGEAIGEYRETDVGAVAHVVAAAERAFAATRHGPRRVRAAWLTAIADAFDAAPGDLLAVADRETALGSARLTGEWARTARRFGSVSRTPPRSECDHESSVHFHV